MGRLFKLSFPVSFRFTVNEEDLRSLIEDRSLNDVLKDKKLFIVDYSILDGIKGVKNKTVIVMFCS